MFTGELCPIEDGLSGATEPYCERTTATFVGNLNNFSNEIFKTPSCCRLGFFIAQLADSSNGRISDFRSDEASSILASAATLRERQNGCLLIRRMVKVHKQDSVCLVMF